MSEVLPWSAPTLEGRIESEGRSGEALLSRARIEANRLRRSILSAATLEAEKLRSNAEEEGFLSGYASGRDQAALEMKKELQLLQSAAGEEIASFQREYEERWAAAMGSLSEQLVELALAACRKLVGQVPREQLPMEQIRRAIEVGDDGGVVHLKVHPDDANHWPCHLNLKVIPDESLNPGEFRIRGGAGEVDGTWKERWERLRAVLEEGEAS